eukprot:2925439-Rhodomonas_salina.1
MRDHVDKAPNPGIVRESETASRFRFTNFAVGLGSLGTSSRTQSYGLDQILSLHMLSVLHMLVYADLAVVNG